MLGLLGGLGMTALKTLVPAAINWGVKKLSQSSPLGRTVLAPTLSHAMRTHTLPDDDPPPPVTSKASELGEDNQSEWQDVKPKKKKKVKGIVKKAKRRG